MVLKLRDKIQGYMGWKEKGGRERQVDAEEVELQISESNVVRAVRNAPAHGMNSRIEDTPSHSFGSMQMITEENALGAALTRDMYKKDAGKDLIGGL